MTETVSEPEQITVSLASSSAFSRFPAASTRTQQLQQQALLRQRPDPELETKVKKACERVSENLHICANEPSLALFRLAEHVRKALPPTVESRQEVKRLRGQLRGAFYDAEYGLETVYKMEGAAQTLGNVQELLKNAIFLQQQINYEQQRRGRREPSMYQRFSAHISSVDLPDFSDLKETARETASRVESVLSRGSSSDKRVIGPPVSHISRAASLNNSEASVEKTAISRSLSVTTATNQQLQK